MPGIMVQPAVLVVALLVVGVLVYFLLHSSTAASTTAAPTAASASCSTYFQAQPGSGGLESTGYTCPGKTQIDGVCVVADAATAEALCAPDPACTGYVVGNLAGWGGYSEGASMGAVALTNGTAPNSYFPDSMYYKKINP